MWLGDGGGRSLDNSELIVNVYCNIKNLEMDLDLGNGLGLGD